MSTIQWLIGLGKDARNTQVWPGLEEILHDRRRGSIAADGPGTGVAVGVVANLYGDVAHGSLPGIGEFLFLLSIQCAPTKGYFQQTELADSGSLRSRLPAEHARHICLIRL